MWELPELVAQIEEQVRANNLGDFDKTPIHQDNVLGYLTTSTDLHPKIQLGCIVAGFSMYIPLLLVLVFS
jgi:hypothetical protein